MLFFSPVKFSRVKSWELWDLRLLSILDALEVSPRGHRHCARFGKNFNAWKLIRDWVGWGAPSQSWTHRVVDPMKRLTCDSGPEADLRSPGSTPETEMSSELNTHLIVRFCGTQPQ